MLYGRGEQSVRIERMLAQARKGRSSALVLVGESGIGKTSLLQHAREKARGFRVLQANAVRAEGEVSYAGLDQLLGAARGSFADIPEPQAAALGAALDMTSSARLDRDAVLRGTHSVLTALAAEGPMLCTVDDAHLLDSGSLAAISFAARRLEDEGVVMLLARRDVECDPELDGLETEELGGLGLEDARALLEAERPGLVAPEVVARLVEATGGNPLALLEAPSLLSEAQLAGQVPLDYPLPLGEGLAQAFAERAEALSEDARRALVTAAAADTHTLRVITEDGAVPGVTPGALEECEVLDLVRIRNGRVAFRHPLARAAVYKAASPSAQRDAHRRLAEASLGERRALHLAAAAIGPDEEAAAELERAGERALVRSGYATAAGWFEQAADLTPEPADRAHRLAAAAKAARVAGRPDRARALATAGLELADDPAVRADLSDVIADLDAAQHPEREASPTPPSDAPSHLGSEPQLLDEPEALVLLADALLAAGRPLSELGEPVELAAAVTRRREALWFLARALVHRARLGILSGSWREAELDALEARRLAGELGQARAQADACCLLAGLEARRGRAQECVSLLDEMLAAQDVPETRAARAAVLGLLDLGVGRLNEAIEELEAGLESDVFPGSTLTATADLVEAYVRAGRTGAAKELAGDARRRSGPFAPALAAWCKALAGSGGASTGAFRKALALLDDQDAYPFERARIELNYGERLRRSRARTEAREHLRVAHELFERLEAAPWAERARAELKATGETARRRDPSSLDELTPQELQVLRAIAAGASYKEAAEALFLSPKTIEYHLAKVYRKLGVHSRRELLVSLERLRAEGADVVSGGQEWPVGGSDGTRSSESWVAGRRRPCTSPTRPGWSVRSRSRSSSASWSATRPSPSASCSRRSSPARSLIRTSSPFTTSSSTAASRTSPWSTSSAARCGRSSAGSTSGRSSQSSKGSWPGSPTPRRSRSSIAISSPRT